MVDDTIIFVNQDNEDSGEGTYENPYASLDSVPGDARYLDGSWIYIFSSDDVADTYADAHLTLLDDMVLWGQGYEHPVYGLGGGVMPILDGGYSGGDFENYADESVIILADNNEVMGLTIQNGVEGIYGSIILGTNIHDNLIRWNPSPEQPVDASGIHISNLFAADDINGMTLDFLISDNRIIDNGSVGIYLVNEVDGAVTDVTLNNTLSGNTLYGNFNSSSDNNANANVYVSNYVHGGDVTNLMINNTFSGNTISQCGEESCSNSVDFGIKLYNRITPRYYDPGLNETVSDGSINNAQFNNLFEHNTITGLEADDIYYSGTAVYMIQMMDAETIDGAFSNNTFSENTFSNNDGAGIVSDQNSIRAASTSTVTDSHQIWNIDDNSIQNNGMVGFYANNDYFSGDEDSFTDCSTEFYFRNNRVTGNGSLNIGSTGDSRTDGIYLYTDTSRDRISRIFFMEGNLVAGNAGDGVDYYWNGSDPASIQVDFGGGSLGSLGGNAFYDNGTSLASLYDIEQDDSYFTTSALYNWWGQASGFVDGQVHYPALIDASSPLTSDPFQ